MCDRRGHTADKCRQMQQSRGLKNVSSFQNVSCYRCGQFGHIQRYCRVPRPMAPVLPLEFSNKGASCTMKVSINGMHVTGLVDSGSPRTFISAKSPLITLLKHKYVNPPLHFFGIGGAPFCVNSSVICNIQFPGGHVNMCVLVTPQSPTELILGCDFLHHARAQLDFSKATVAAITSVPNPLTSVTSVEPEVVMNRDGIKVHNDWISKLKVTFPNVFSNAKHDIGQTQLITHDIDTGSNVPFKITPYRTPLCEKEIVAKEIDSMCKNKIIQPSFSPWASPYIMVNKKGNGKRFCLDFRKLNSLTVKDSYPLPRIDDCLDRLGNAKIFSTIDLASGYWQVPLTQRSKPKTAFLANNSSYEFNVMPFGLCNAPSTFQRLMNKLLDGCGDFTMAYLDDIIIFSNSIDEHSKHVHEVFERIQNARLKIRPEKCCFQASTFDFLGYKITTTGIKPTTEKVNKLKNFVPPKDKKSLKRFLGFAAFYRRFVPRYAELAAPLDEVAKPHATFIWTAETEKSFNEIINKISTAETLAFVRENLPFELNTDASGIALGAVLSQKYPDGTSRPVSFASRKLSQAETRYSTIDREALALSWGMEHFKAYLLGHHVTVFTDHKPLLGLLTAPHVTERQFRLLEPLAAFDYKLHHLPGKENVVADILSRDVSLAAATVPEDPLETRIRQAQLDDEEISTVVALLNGVNGDGKYSKFIKFVQSNIKRFKLVDKNLFCDHKLVVPRSMVLNLMTVFHENGHFDSKRTLAKIASRFWWYGMSTDVIKHVKKCLSCASSKSNGKMQFTQGMLPSPGPYELVFVDLVGPLPSCRGYSYILTMEDSYTRWVEAIPLTSITAEAIASAFVKHWVYRFGPPVSVHSDQGTQFESSLFSQMCNIFGMTKSRTTAYHPQGNGALERFHRTLKERLLTSPNGKDWVNSLPPALYAYRTVPHSTTAMTPFQLTFGFTPQIPQDWPAAFSNKKEGYVESLRQYWNMIYVKEGEPGKAKQKLNIGDLVFVRIPQTTKLQKPWCGPHRVTKINGPTTVEVANNGVVHINRLKFFSVASSSERGQRC